MRRRPERWSTPFGSWVARFTVARVAEELQARGDPIRRATVYGWLSGVIAPRPPRALALVEMSGGAVALDDVYGHREQIVTEARR